APISRTVLRMASWRPEWPFDCYPTFAYPTPDLFEIWEARWVLPSGEVRVRPEAYAAALGSSALLWNIVNRAGQETDAARFRELSMGLTRSLWQKESSDIRATATGAN